MPMPQNSSFWLALKYLLNQILQFFLRKKLNKTEINKKVTKTVVKQPQNQMEKIIISVLC